MEGDGSLDKMHNKESSAIRREMSRMNRNFEGILELEKMPAAMFVVDTRTEAIAVAEANRLKIPVIALVDTNSDPSLVQYPIPGNDDSIKSIRMIVEVLMDAVQEGLSQRAVQEPVVPTRKVTPLGEDKTFEQQVPVTVLSPDDEDGNSVPEVFSSDPGEDASK
jgi:small subunit ribosomal protein S2